MEPVGLAVGVFALAGLFNNAVDCFAYIPLGKNIKQDFTTCCLKLSDANLRLSRWGEAVGLSGNLRDVDLPNRIFRNKDVVDNARARLEHILELFSKAENISNKFLSENKSNKLAVQLYDPQQDLNHEMQSLNSKLHALSLKRRNITSLQRKAQWALYEEKHFRQLIEDVTSAVDGLVELFPAVQPSQEKLCDREAAELLTESTRQVLEAVSAEQDTMLAAAVAKTNDRIHMTNNWNNSEGTRVANQVASLTVHGGQTINCTDGQPYPNGLMSDSVFLQGRFLVRDGIYQFLLNALRSEGGCRTVLYSLAGVGKTAMMRYFAHTIKTEKNILWILATSEDDIRASFSKYAQQLGAGSVNISDPASFIAKRIDEKFPADFLIIFDGLDNSSINLGPYLFSDKINVSVFITTQRRQLGSGIGATHEMQVTSMDNDAAEDLLTTVMSTFPRTEAKKDTLPSHEELH
ncbi:hypothetical protein KCU78_g1976, partial [Aureobasidium melanogenum]